MGRMEMCLGLDFVILGVLSNLNDSVILYWGMVLMGWGWTWWSWRSSPTLMTVIWRSVVHPSHTGKPLWSHGSCAPLLPEQKEGLLCEPWQCGRKHWEPVLIQRKGNCTGVDKRKNYLRVICQKWLFRYFIFRYMFCSWAMVSKWSFSVQLQCA